jgi:thiol reductant ABC exporter CydD subunit
MIVMPGAVPAEAIESSQRSHARGAPFDRRLLRWSRATRPYLAITVAIGTLTALLVLAQAWLIATIVSGAAVDGGTLASLAMPVWLLLAVVIGRAVLAWCSEWSANRSSARVKSDLRVALASRSVDLGADGLPLADAGDVVTLTTQGIDALDGYFSRYLPQLVLAVVVPAAVIIAMATQDWVAAAIVTLTLPLIPVFMAVIGMSAQRSTDQQLRALQKLASRFLDTIAGLSTLKIFGRARDEEANVRAADDAYRRTTMATLRLAFLSSLVLEFIASIAVALVAVAVGLRLLHGHLDFHTALFVLVVAPEAYLPLRRVGASFHASAPGLSAAADAFEVLDRPRRARVGGVAVSAAGCGPIDVGAVSVWYPGRSEPALRTVSLVIEPGEVLALTGPSGCGKSTLLAVLLGLVRPTTGTVRVGGVDLEAVDLELWRESIGWVPQRPHLFAVSVAENVRLARPGASDADVLAALDAAGLREVVDRLPHGAETVLGERGAGLSAGQRQRVALARAFVRDAPLVLLDEPTANLDGVTEAAVLDAIDRLVAGRTVVIAAHRPRLVAFADRRVALDRAR